jgi:hypothetical protein
MPPVRTIRNQPGAVRRMYRRDHMGESLYLYDTG